MKKGFLTGLLSTVALLATLETPRAQQSVQIVQKICETTSGPTRCSYVPVTTSAPLNIQGAVTGTFSATLGGFTPASSPRMTPLSVTVGGATQALPAAATAAAVLVVQNTDSTNPIFCNVNEAAPTVADQKIPANSWFAFTLPSPAPTDLECISTGGTVVANGTVGAGLPTGAGGGGGSGGGGGAVTIADGADVTLGAKADAASASTDTTPITLMQVLKEISAKAQAPAPVTGTVTANAGTNLNTSALATDAHLTSFTSANHTDLGTINTTLGTPMQASGGTVTVTQATSTNLKAQVNVASGGIASGGIASGAGADGWDVTEGTKADAAWVSGSGSVVSLLKTIAGAGASSNITGWGGGTLGAMANYGTSPGAVLVPGANVFVTNTNANGQAAAAASSPVVGATGTISGGTTGTAGSASANVVTVQGVASMTPVQTAPSAYPATAVPITASATGTTGATTATLTNVTAHTTYICGFSIRANATAAATGNATVTGTITGTLNFTQWTAPLASGLGVTEEVFTPCVPASAVSTSIAVVSAAPGTGGVVSVTAWGFSI